MLCSWEGNHTSVVGITDCMDSNRCSTSSTYIPPLSFFSGVTDYFLAKYWLPWFYLSLLYWHLKWDVKPCSFFALCLLTYYTVDFFEILPYLE